MNLNYRAVLRGAVLDVGGSLIMSTVIGTAAVVGLVWSGETPEAIVEELPRSEALVFFVAAAGLLMSVAGGYVAAAFASRAYFSHALWTGLLSTVLNIALLWTVGTSGPDWLTAATLVSITPCAVLGGWLAMPVVTPLAFPAKARR